MQTKLLWQNSKIINYVQDRLTDIKEDWAETEGKGFCHCKNCGDDAGDSVQYHGVCNELVSGCNRNYPKKYNGNETEKAICDNVNQCATCRAVSSTIYKYRVLHMDWYQSEWWGYFSNSSGWNNQLDEKRGTFEKLISHTFFFNF